MNSIAQAARRGWDDPEPPRKIRSVPVGTKKIRLIMRRIVDVDDWCRCGSSRLDCDKSVGSQPVRPHQVNKFPLTRREPLGRNLCGS